MSNIQIEHDSRNAAFRFPIGAAEAGTEVSLALRVRGAYEAHGTVRLWQDGVGETLIPLSKVPKNPNQTDDATWFEAKVKLPEEGGLIWYYFVMEADGRIIFYGNSPGQLGGMGMATDGPPGSFQITVYDHGADTPAWFRRAVMYQIFPDRFHRTKLPTHQKKGAVIHSAWSDPPCYYKDPDTKEIIAYDFYGGSFDGIIEKLHYLKELGISVIYMNPIFEAESNHRYDTGDYHRPDPFLGTEEDFVRLIDEARKLGIRIILDGVFSHTGANSRYFNQKGEYDSIGAYQSKYSKYFSWYDFTDWPRGYHSWWGFTTLPNVRETEPSYMDFVINSEDSVLHHWSRLGVSGWRLDVIDELPPKFSREFYRELKKTDKDAVLIGEIWEDASNKVSYGEQRAYLSGHEVDSAMNYPFRSIVHDFLLFRASGEDAMKRMETLRENYPAQNFYAMMNLLGSHDVERLMTLMGEADPPGENERERALYRLDERRAAIGRARTEIAFTWQMTMPGVPSIYYGDEIGMQGYRDPYNRAPYDWETGDTALREKARALIKLRNENTALSTGEYIPLTGEGDIFAYARVIKSGHDKFGEAAKNVAFVVAMNRSMSEAKTLRLDVGDFAAEKFRLVFSTDEFIHPDAKKADEFINSDTEKAGEFINSDTKKEDEFIKPDAEKSDDKSVSPGKNLTKMNEIPVNGGGITVTLPPLSAFVWKEEREKIGAPREAGVLLHITSLPSKYGIGDLGGEARAFIEFLCAAGQKVWQVLPLGPVGPGNSPYQPPSAFAGNPLLIDPDLLSVVGLLTGADLAMAREAIPRAKVHSETVTDSNLRVPFDRVKAVKSMLLRRAWERFQKDPHPEFSAFCEREKEWLDDYALFEAAREESGGKSWTEWEPSLRRREKSALDALRGRQAEEIEYIKFVQYIFFRQWSDLHDYARERGVKIFGDMPLYLAGDSADVWAHQELFSLDEAGKSEKVAGVPPDYFSETGQLWGNPLYRWDVSEKDGFHWWTERMAHLARLVDVVRIDHFRGLASYWEVAAGEETAKNGRWRKGPGMALIEALRKKLGDFPIIAEDLGVLTDDVVELLDASGFPGMKVLQFECVGNGTPRVGFTTRENTALYTGTHDNDTTAGWFDTSLSYEKKKEVAAWLGLGGEDVGSLAPKVAEWMVEAAYDSPARLVIAPIQDILGLSGENRMNVPGTPYGNWTWRLAKGLLNSGVARRMRALAEKYGR